jgi:hypothetical protein
MLKNFKPQRTASAQSLFSLSTATSLDFSVLEPVYDFSKWHSPLWKRGAGGDLKAATCVNKTQIPLSPPFPKGAAYPATGRIPSRNVPFSEIANRFLEP